MKKLLLLLTIIFSFALATTVFGNINHKKAYTVPKQTFKLKVKGAKKVKWSTSNKNVAAVKKGKVKTYKKGTATITAKVGKKKYKCKVKVWTKKKMQRELKDVYEYFNYLVDKTVDRESYSSIKKGIEITQNMQSENAWLMNNLLGKKYKGFKKDYKRAVKQLKSMNNHLKLILAVFNEKDEYGDHTELYYSRCSDYSDDTWTWWEIRCDLAIHTWSW